MHYLRTFQTGRKKRIDSHEFTLKNDLNGFTVLVQHNGQISEIKLRVNNELMAVSYYYHSKTNETINYNYFISKGAKIKLELCCKKYKRYKYTHPSAQIEIY